MTQTIHSKSGMVSLEIRDSGMSAWITVKKSNRLVSEREILELIDAAGIKAGFEDAQHYIREHNLEKDFEQPFPIAFCKSPSEKRELHYYFDTEAAKKLRDSAEPSTLKKLDFVLEGTAVAGFSSNLFDREGSIYNIFGEIIASEEPATEHSEGKAGEGIRFDSNRNCYIATSTGYPYLDRGGKICLLDTIYLKQEAGDSDYPLHIPVNLSWEGDLEGAEIYCKGKVFINGSISNSRIYSEQDVDISGSLSGSELQCEGNLRIDGQIEKCVGMGIRCGGELTARTILSSYVICKGFLNLGKLISESFVVADAGLRGGSGGTVQDSHVQACGSIELSGLGRMDGKATELEITISPYYKNVLTRLTKNLIKLKEQSEQNQEEIERVNREIRDCEKELDNELNSFLRRDSGRRFSIRVSGDVHAPAEIRILKHSYTIKSYQNGLDLEEKD